MTWSSYFWVAWRWATLFISINIIFNYGCFGKTPKFFYAIFFISCLWWCIYSIWFRLLQTLWRKTRAFSNSDTTTRRTLMPLQPAWMPLHPAWIRSRWEENQSHQSAFLILIIWLIRRKSHLHTQPTGKALARPFLFVQGFIYFEAWSIDHCAVDCTWYFYVCYLLMVIRTSLQFLFICCSYALLFWQYFQCCIMYFATAFSTAYLIKSFNLFSWARGKWSARFRALFALMMPPLLLSIFWRKCGWCWKGSNLCRLSFQPRLIPKQNTPWHFISECIRIWNWNSQFCSPTNSKGIIKYSMTRDWSL